MCHLVAVYTAGGPTTAAVLLCDTYLFLLVLLVSLVYGLLLLLSALPLALLNGMDTLSRWGEGYCNGTNIHTCMHARIHTHTHLQIEQISSRLVLTQLFMHIFVPEPVCAHHMIGVSKATCHTSHHHHKSSHTYITTTIHVPLTHTQASMCWQRLCRLCKLKS